jgi:hypothetical protein
MSGKKSCAWMPAQIQSTATMVWSKGAFTSFAAFALKFQVPPHWGVYIEGIPGHWRLPMGEIPFHPRRFRPIVERKTDISIFEEMLTSAPNELKQVK